MEQLIVKIGQKQYLISSLKGYSKTKFLKEGHSEEDFLKLEKWIEQKPVKKAKKKRDA